MRPVVVHTLCAVMLVGSAIVGCRQTPAARRPAAEPMTALSVSGRHAAFSADRAWEHLRALTEIGPRVMDTEGSAKARRYIQSQLEELNLEVHVDEHDMLSDDESETEDGESEEGEAESDSTSLFVNNISVTIPGELGSGSILLIAPYDTRFFDEFDFVGANDGGSGAAVLLELSRVIAADPLPYTTEVVFVDGHAQFSIPGGDGAKGRWAGFARLAFVMEKQGVSGIHLVVYLNRIGDADLQIARDRQSDRVYRQDFFKAARRLGQTDAFPEVSPYESTGLRHRFLSSIGLRKIVSIVDTAFGGDEPPGLYAGTEQDTLDHCAPESLNAVGRVVLEGLEAISKRLLKIEHYSPFPYEEPPEPESEPEEPEESEPEESEPEPEPEPELESEPEPEAAEPSGEETQR